MSDRQETYIYESPDGGHTVYRRLIGSDTKELYSLSEERRKWDLRFAREQLWHDILKTGDRDPELKGMLDQVEVYYRLKSQP